ncbi:NACHT domain-containing protein [Streptomyces sp. NPDC060184]|uniref:NACHT domain-containing protein n=1 Tax=Streptomyces sp. NPDC060184 TaxID=3347064 RepID=UPI00364FAEDD
MNPRRGPQEPHPTHGPTALSSGPRSSAVGGSNYGIINTGDQVIIQVTEAPGPWDQAAQNLATRVYGQLVVEGENQKIWVQTKPLPVHCRPAPRTLAIGHDDVLFAPRTAGGDSALPKLDEWVRRMAGFYQRAERGKLVVLGRAGSGKSILIQHFARTLLEPENRPATAQIPVIFSLGSWNPRRDSLRNWLIACLDRDHPTLAEPASDGSTWAGALLGANRLLVILDGFDEIADGLRGRALERLRASGLSLLVTSRRAELEAAVAGPGPVPFVGIELDDLTLDDSVTYLLRPTGATPADDSVSTPPGKWAHVFNEMRESPGDPKCGDLAAVLTTPLMVALARTVYATGRDPADLLKKFDGRQAIEDHLLDAFVPSAYEEDPPEGPTPAKGGKGEPASPPSWDPERVPHWLGYLATHLSELGTHDIEWWNLGTSMSLTSRALVTGAMTGLLTGVALGAVTGLLFGLGLGGAPDQAAIAVLLNTLGIGPAFALMHVIMSKLKVGGAFTPSRMRLRLRGGTRKVRDSFLPRVRAGIIGGLIFGAVLGAGAVVYYAILGATPLFMFLMFGNSLTIGLGEGLAGGIIVALLAALEDAIPPEETVSWSVLLDRNRTTVLTEMLALAVVIGLGYGALNGLFNGPRAALEGITVGLAIGGGLCTLTAWGRWVVLVRVWLPLTGRLPWRVRTFLDDAYARGVLRQSGAVHQFRHARLRDRLAATYPQHGRPTAGEHS